MVTVKINPDGVDVIPTTPKENATAPRKEESIISRLISILIMDVKCKIYGEKPQIDLEAYERFAELARGKR
jgi:hypothetical protein